MAQLKSTNITGNLAVTGNILASKIIKLGGTSSQILMADGSTLDKGNVGSGSVTSVTVTGNNGLTGTGTVTTSGEITLSHATSSISNLEASNRTYVKSLTFDSYGHVTGYTTGVETVVNNNTTYSFADGEDSFKVTPSGGSAQTVKVTNRLIQSPDTRSISYVPQDVSTGVVFDFKSKSTVTNSGENFGASGSYLGVMTWRSYGSAADLSGGPVFQLGYDTSGNLWRRTSGSGTGWNNWVRLTTTSDIPTVNNAKLTIQKNGSTVATFTADASTDVTANITVPTKTSELTNDSGFWTGTKYWANVAVSGSSSTATTPIVKSLGVSDGSSATATAKATWQYNSTTDCIELVWA